MDDLENQIGTADEFHLRKSGVLTGRFIDEEQIAGHRPYFSAFAHIAGGFEHFDILWNLINGDQGITPRAPYSLMRPIFEHGFWAQWILCSEVSQIRRQRGLRSEVLDRKQRKAWLDCYNLSGEQKATAEADHKRVTDIYKAECASLHLAWKTAGDKPNLVVELPKLPGVIAFGNEFGTISVGTWRILSGLTHGGQYALQIMSEASHEQEIERGVRRVIAIDDDAFLNNARISLFMLMEAARLYIRRSTEPVRRCAAT